MRDMRSQRYRLGLLVVLAGCQGSAPVDAPGPHEFPFGAEDSKEDAFGRALAGIAAPYEPDVALAGQETRLASEMGYRRQVGWEIVARTLDSVPLLGLAERAGDDVTLADGSPVPRVPRFETWYGVDDFKRMFQHLYEKLGAPGRAAREPFDEAALASIFEWNAGALERSSRWPLERFLSYVNQLGVCPEGTPEDECARLVQSNFSGAAGGNVRITYSPGTMMHLLRSYPDIVACLERLGGLRMDAMVGSQASLENFTLCFETEMPADAVLVKAQWVRADFNMPVRVYDTDAAAIGRHLDPTLAGDWGTGERTAQPPADRIYTIRLRNGSTYRLAGLHIMTKETRHWMWVSLFWSESPDTDFGADRPAFIRERLDPVFANYKMCVVAAYEEGDPDVGRWFESTPSLAEALRASASAGAPTWCSNPYVEEGRGNARTNCIGCHQHGGSTVAFDLTGDDIPDPLDLNAIISDEARFPSNGRTQIRELFPADYTWSFNRVDDISHVIRSEVEHFDFVDAGNTSFRAGTILMLMGNAVNGSETFAMNCTRCHGEDGRGTSRAPSLYDRVPMRDDLSIVTTLIGGRGAMPAWGDTFSNQIIADLLAHLRETFDSSGPARTPALGEIVLTEIMYDPQAVDDAAGEWIELHNPTTSILSLDACSLVDGDGESTSLAGLVVPPSGYVTIARSSSLGFTPDATTTMELANDGERLAIRCDALEIDAVDYTTGFPRAFGASLSLDPASTNALDNDAGNVWCWGTTAFGAGDFGSPGAANPVCM